MVAGLRIHSKPLVNWYQITRRHKRNNSNLYTNLREYLTSYLNKRLKEFLKVTFWNIHQRGFYVHRTINLVLYEKIISFPVVHRLPVFSCRICRFIASSDVKFLCFITLSTSLSHFTSGRPRRLLPSGRHVVIRLGHLLSSMYTTCPYHFNIFSILSRIICVTSIFSLILFLP